MVSSDARRLMRSRPVQLHQSCAWLDIFSLRLVDGLRLQGVGMVDLVGAAAVTALRLLRPTCAAYLVVPRELGAIEHGPGQVADGP